MYKVNKLLIAAVKHNNSVLVISLFIMVATTVVFHSKY
jgi:hypothetical protein